ncbi:MAG: tctC [Ramlibacter sp.]|jgi:tripartite-type tricarboxylate transporter receptor subunit TctC|uniref:Bug family tripartite tricarboxylate transporter substrate binding protein n=1 Tax=Ramlibacter sp. TaxID=1917967 RepID=UPI00262373E9|nr:tripartite tricarboxylate transporter substrate binding protein [Ramlibacter sp.]MDB5750019.1 tctC [Ramlibacter sp.]
MFHRVLHLLAAALLAAAGAGAAAQTYPDRPVTLVVPFAAGSGTDAVARVVAQKLGERLKQPVVIDNRAGANAQIGVEHAAKAAPDGYTLLMTTATSHSVNPALYKSLRYHPINDFTPIGRTGILPFVVTVRPSLPVKTIRELIEYARANPGKVSFATSNSTSMLASEALAKMAQAEMISVTYKSAPQALTDMLAGHLDMYVVDFGVGLPSIRSGKLRPLAMTNAQRSPLLPDVPVLADTLPGFDLNPWNGIFGPAGLPKPIVDKLAAELYAVLADSDTHARFAAVGFDVSPTRTSEEFRKYVADQLASYAQMARIARVQPQ